MSRAGGTQSPDRWALGPLTRAISAEDFARWLDSAQAGARLEYAEGPEEPRGFPVWRAVSAAVCARQVSAHRTRTGRGFSFLVERRPEPAAAPAARQFPADSDEARLLSLLNEVATEGGLCPCNAEIAAGLGLCGLSKARARERARYLLNKLRRAGAIRVSERPGERRIVTIVATGKRTRAGKVNGGK